jgi:hypothetical protein
MFYGIENRLGLGMLKKARPARPERAKRRGGYIPACCVDRSPRIIDWRTEKPLQYFPISKKFLLKVEHLSDARTMLADFSACPPIVTSRRAISTSEGFPIVPLPPKEASRPSFSFTANATSGEKCATSMRATSMRRETRDEEQRARHINIPNL